MKEEPRRIEHVFPNIEDWPIYKLSEDRRNFVQEIDEFTLERFMRKPSPQLTDIISKAIYQERIRMKEEPWKVDPPNERQFWRRIQNKLVGRSLDRSEEEARKTNEEILRQIIHRYSEEIVGTFRISTFLFARRFLTLFLPACSTQPPAVTGAGYWGRNTAWPTACWSKGKWKRCAA